jgi:hypothetical protein
MAGMRRAYVDADQCNEKVSVVTYRHEAATKSAIDALA